MDGRSKILIVDDESSLRKVLGDLLRLRGYTPESVATGAEAVAAAKANKHDAAIVDIGLGDEGMDGLDVIKEIKSCSPRTQCIVLTGMPSQESAITAMNLGAYAYLRKPFNVDELLATIGKALEAGRDVASGTSAKPTATAAANSATQKFTKYVRDELRSPLGSVIGLAQNIVEADSTEDAKAFARILQTEAQGILENLERFLARIAAEQAERRS
ncbi:MAG: response regulator [Lentisphaeria bacterium]|jgi:DNA-binding NtrC family response regulator|nr:response regulator [Lentisphaeria bacterium]